MNREKYLEEQVELLREEKRELVEVVDSLLDPDCYCSRCKVARTLLARVDAKEK